MLSYFSQSVSSLTSKFPSRFGTTPPPPRSPPPPQSDTPLGTIMAPQPTTATTATTSYYCDDDEDDFDLCGIAQGDTRFQSALKSPYCPKVGACGHSFCDQSLRQWFEARKEDEYHKNSKVLPCPYRCSETKREKGVTVNTEIAAFRPNQLVPNHSLCQLIQVIRHAQQKKKPTPTTKRAAASVTLCTKCQCQYTLDESKHSPRVGLCGHTVCLACLQNLAKPSGKRKSIKTIACPLCQQGKAFQSDRFVENIEFGKALRHWKTILAPVVDVKSASAKKKPASKKPTPVAANKKATETKREPAGATRKSKRTRAASEEPSEDAAAAAATTTTTTTASRPNKRFRRAAGKRR